MTDRMRAMVLHERRPVAEHPLRLEERPIPEPGPGELRVAVRACGLCRTDLHVIEGDLADRRTPIVPGHQVVGVVDALGAGAKRFREGDRVGIAWLRGTCGRCRFCASGRENLCPDSTYTGWTHDGGYAERAVVSEDYAYAIPDAIGDAEATPLLCAGIIGFRSLERAALPEGGRLGLYGFGSSAHIVIQLALARGAEVHVVTRGASHRALAREMGATWVGDMDERPPAPLQSAILFAPVGELVPPALEALDRGGILSLAGIHMTDTPPLRYDRHLFHEKEIRSVESNTREDGRRLLEEAAAIPIRPHTTGFVLEEANAALERLATDGIDGTGVLMMEDGAR